MLKLMLHTVKFRLQKFKKLLDHWRWNG